MANHILILAVLALHSLAANYYMKTYSKNRAAKTKPIEKQKAATHPTREAFKTENRRVYIIFGGCEFIGAWFARYLILRKEKIIIMVDDLVPPNDVLKHGALHYYTDTSDIHSMDRTFSEILDSYCLSGAEVIVYNCIVSRRYAQNRLHPSCDLGLRSTELLLLSLTNYEQRRVTIINISDTMSLLKPVHWMQWWKRDSWVQKLPNDSEGITPFPIEDRSDVATSYGWYQGAVESLLLTATGNYAAASLRTEGLVSGHVGDHQLTDALQFGYGVCHSPNVPVSILHVEDLVRAGLALEYMMLDPATRSQYTQRAFTVYGPEDTTLPHIYDYIKKRRDLKVLNVDPVVAWIVGWVVTVISVILSFVGIPSITSGRSRTTNLLCPSFNSLSWARFTTVQVCRVRNHKNHERTKDLLKYRHNFHLSNIIDDIINEMEAAERGAKLH